MNMEALFLFLILLLGLVLCSFLGGNCGYEGFDNIVQKDAEFIGENGGTLVINENSDGTQNLDVTLPNGEKIILTSQNDKKKEGYTDRNVQVFYGPNGERGEVITDIYGRVTIRVVKNNTIYLYNPNTGKSVTITGAATPSITAYDNYQHGQINPTNIPNGAEFIGTNGGKLVVNTNSDGTQKLAVTLPNGEKITFSSKKYKKSDTFLKDNNDYTKNVFYGPNGEKAEVVTAYDGKVTIYVNKNNIKYIFNPYTGYDDMSSTQYYGSTGYHTQTYQGAYQGDYGNTPYYSDVPYYGEKTATANANANAPYGPASSPVNYAQGSNGQNAAANYNNSLPPGVPRSMIPPGDEDLYILKSQVVPPVCPVCPAANDMLQSLAEIKETKCPPCKPCDRCPEPSFECKKVPNYNAIGNNELPIPVLNDFSTFGM